MNRNQKKLRGTRGLALALSLLLAVTILVTAIAITAARKSKSGNAETTTTPADSTTTTTTTTTTTRPITERPDEKTVSADPDSFFSPVPKGELLKDFSSDIPVFSLTMEDYRVHSGVDIGAAVGTPVLASADGVITEVYSDPMMGQTVVITHSDSVKSVYKCLGTKIPDGIKTDTVVKQGDTIGYVGDTALVEISELPHVHFELIRDGKAANPLSYFDVAVSALPEYEN